MTSHSIYFASDIFAKEITSDQKGLDLVFVIDSSGSMKTNDSEKIALEMVKAFIDTVHIDQIRIGFVAYNDTIVSEAVPAAIVREEDRELLKQKLDLVAYSGDTDIGLGLSRAYEIIKPATDRRRIMVLISDGVSDLKGIAPGRTLEQSNHELEETVQICSQEDIAVYTIAFGNYDGSKTVLEEIASATGADSYTANSQESLIEVFYGIFEGNLYYEIKEIASGLYASGNQEIQYIADEKYVDEMDILLVSSKSIGETRFLHGSDPIPLQVLPHYAVGKTISPGELVKNISIQTTTTENQALKAYLIQYRNLAPIMNIESVAEKNKDIPYRIYFKDKNGAVIKDKLFYETFNWQMYLSDQDGVVECGEITETRVDDEGISGILRFSQAGDYLISGMLSDELGAYQFHTEWAIPNTAPEGTLPKLSYHTFSGEKHFDLNEYFQDSDGDLLTYTLGNGTMDVAEVTLTGSDLTVVPGKLGIQTLTLHVSDGSDTMTYSQLIEVQSLWRVYWWVLVFAGVLVAVMLWKLLSRPQAVPEQIEDIKSRSHFNGRLDLYFTKLPEELGEIPPLVFPMHKMREGKVRLGDLLKAYPQETAALGLHQVYLIADEDRKMILFHSTDATVMLGNSIVCRKVRCSLSFGDVLYITSTDGDYDLELHYISMIQ